MAGKVARSARHITQSLWGPKGRPETNDYLDRCAEQHRSRTQAAGKSLVVVEEIRPRENQGPRRKESRRTENKWAMARARAGK